MAWPTRAEIQTRFEKLNDSALNTKIDGALSFAIARVHSALASAYDTSAFASSTPQILYEIAALLTYGYFASRVHTGSRTTPSDEAAKDARDYAESLLEKLAKGEMALVDSSFVLIERRGTPEGYVYRRTDGPVFTMDEPHNWTTTLLEDGDELT